MALTTNIPLSLKCPPSIKPSLQAPDKTAAHSFIQCIKDYAIIRLDSEGYILSWNEGARLIHGCEATDIIGRHLSCFYLADELAWGKPDFELHMAKKEGRFWADVILTRVLDQSGCLAGFTQITRDLSSCTRNEDALRQAKRTLEEEIKRRTRELEKANRELKAVNRELVESSLIKSQFTAIKEGVNLVLEEGDGSLNEEQKHLLAIAKKNAERLSRLISNVLDYSHLESASVRLNRVPTDLNAAIREIYDLMLIPVEAKGAKLILNLTEKTLTACCDADKIKQVIINLLENAVKFTPPQGSITLSAWQAGQEAQVTVEDTGIGISPEDEAKIFRIFGHATFRGMWKTGGGGMGLAICKRIVDMHQGTISLKSRPGAGSLFTFSIPISQPKV